MAAWSDNEVVSPLEKRGFFKDNENSRSSTSRSPSIGSFDQWPSFFVSKTLPKGRSVDKGFLNSEDGNVDSRNFMRMLEDEVPGAVDTIYLCNFRVSVDGEWLCLKELQDVELIQENFPDPFTPSPVEPHYIIARDPVIIERRNLVNISKLIVKELIETSLKYGRMLDSDHMPLQHFFIVLEHVLRHGLRPKKGLLGPKKELWDLLQVVEKLTSEAQDITSSVRDLPTVRTQMGRARAWLRLALMQKKLADYLKILIDHRDDILSEFYEPDALLMSDEAIIIVGLLVGLNVIDCNLCVKEEDLDCRQGVIDFSLYLRSSHHTSVGDSPEDDSDLDNMTTVLDQKNYIEELNRHLNATVANLQSKVESLTTTNALMKEDLAIAKKSLMNLTEENNYLKFGKKIDVTSEKADEGGGPKDKESAKEIERLKQELEAEKKRSAEAQAEVSLQISLKAEMEVGMKLLEKDIHDKQDTIVSLRRQLDDIKQINLDMYRKLQECESSLKHKTELISKLEAKTLAMTDSLQIMDDKAKDVESRKIAAEQALVRATEETESLKAEREMRRTFEEELISDKALIKDLQEELNSLRIVSKNYGSLQIEHKKLSDKCHEQEQTLEELGRHLSDSKLEISQLREEVECSNGTNPSGTTNWALDKDATQCKSCVRDFNIRRRRHHCRNCGEIFCHSCSDNFTPIPPATKPVRVCDECQIQLISKNFADSTAYLSRA